MINQIIIKITIAFTLNRFSLYEYKVYAVIGDQRSYNIKCNGGGIIGRLTIISGLVFLDLYIHEYADVLEKISKEYDLNLTIKKIKIEP